MIASLHTEQDDADDFEDNNTGVTAVQGEVTGMPDNADVGWFYDSGDGSVKEETVATGLDLLKSELYEALSFYDAVEVHIQVQQVNYSALEIGLIRSYVACARRGLYLVGSNTDLTVAVRRTWLAANLLGPMYDDAHRTGVVGVSSSWVLCWWIQFRQSLQSRLYLLILTLRRELNLV